jgi:hypothetical protein
VAGKKKRQDRMQEELDASLHEGVVFLQKFRADAMGRLARLPKRQARQAPLSTALDRAA